MNFLSGSTTATGHVVGGVYYSAEHEMTYVVLGVATVWECAPDAAVLIRWDNGNETVATRGAADDVLMGRVTALPVPVPLTVQQLEQPMEGERRRPA